MSDGDAELARASRSAFADSDGGNAVRTRSAASTRRIRASTRVDRAEVAAQRVARELGDLTRDLDAGRAGSDDDERQPRGARARRRAPTSAASNALRMRLRDDRARCSSDFTSAACSLPVVVAEVRVARAARDDQRVVASRLRRRDLRRRCVRADLAAPRGRSPTTSASDDADVPAAARGSTAAERRCWPARVAGCHLVKERLEEMKVAGDRRA